MTRIAPAMRDFATRLIVHDACENRTPKGKTPSAFPVPERLRPSLVALMGSGGFHALLARALALARTEVSWLSAVTLNPDGTLGGLGELHADLGPEKFLEGRVVLLAQLLGLLVAFIGEDLTLRLVREIWPDVMLEGLDLTHKVKNEKTN